MLCLCALGAPEEVLTTGRSSGVPWWCLVSTRSRNGGNAWSRPKAEMSAKIARARAFEDGWACIPDLFKRESQIGDAKKVETSFNHASERAARPLILVGHIYFSRDFPGRDVRVVECEQLHKVPRVSLCAPLTRADLGLLWGCSGLKTEEN